MRFCAMSFCYRNWEDECQAQAVERGSGGRPRADRRGAPAAAACLARRLRSGALRTGDINQFLDSDPGERRFIECTAACGFPSPADDYLEHPLDFNELLIRNPAAMFAEIASPSVPRRGAKRCEPYHPQWD